jgi:hypothetical protein
MLGSITSAIIYINFNIENFSLSFEILNATIDIEKKKKIYFLYNLNFQANYYHLILFSLINLLK